MDWEQLTIIAQIATGVATLAVAAFLVVRRLNVRIYYWL